MPWPRRSPWATAASIRTSLQDAVEDHARDALLFDMDAARQESGAMINAVMLGAIAGIGRLPLPLEAFEAAIRADGKAVDSNLRGFAAGLAAARQGAATPAGDAAAKTPAAAAETLADLEAEAARLPAPAQTSSSRACAG